MLSCFKTLCFPCFPHVLKQRTKPCYKPQISPRRRYLLYSHCNPQNTLAESRAEEKFYKKRNVKIHEKRNNIFPTTNINAPISYPSSRGAQRKLHIAPLRRCRWHWRGHRSVNLRYFSPSSRGAQRKLHIAPCPSDTLPIYAGAAGTGAATEPREPSKGLAEQKTSETKLALRTNATLTK